MPGYLTTHVLDTASGRPANGMKIELFHIEGDSRTRLLCATTNEDGRTNERILPPERFRTGIYELRFHAGDYFANIGHSSERPRFLDIIPIRFLMSEQSHHHVPLLLSPFGYSTYRGS